jgi:hypothetical protein
VRPHAAPCSHTRPHATPCGPMRPAAPCTMHRGFPLGPLAVGADSRFFALLGSAPQELNTTRPEAKLKC